MSYGHQENLVQLYKVRQINTPELTKAVSLTFTHEADWFDLHLKVSHSSLACYLDPPETLGDLRTLKAQTKRVTLGAPN